MPQISEDSLQSPAQVDWISVAVAKFSHNTSSVGNRNFIWNHVGLRNDLDFVISNVRSRDERSGIYRARPVMKVTAGAELLEYQDLSELVSSIRDHGPSIGAEPPVQVVIKCPFLAMRFPKSATTVRRIQLKFRNELDFGRARSVLEELGLPVADTTSAVTANFQTIASSPAPSIFSTTSTSSLKTVATSVTRPPSTVIDNDVSFNSQSHVSSRPAFAASLEGSSGSANLQLETERSRLSSTYQIPNVLQRSTSLILASSSSNRLSNWQDPIKQSPSLYASQVERESQYQQGVDSVKQSTPYSTVRPCNEDPRFSQATSSFNESRTQQMGTPIRQSSASPFHRGSYSGTAAQHFDFGRPTSTPAIHRDIYELCVPPRRNLPFPKPRATSTTLPIPFPDLPPLPKPTYVQSNKSTVSTMGTPTANAATTATPNDVPKKHVVQRKKATPISNQQSVYDTIPPAESRATNVIDSHCIGAIVDEEVSPLAVKSAASAHPSSTLGLQSKAAAPKKRFTPASLPASVAKKLKTIDQGTQTQTLSGRNHTVAGRFSPDPQVNQGQSATVADVPVDYLDYLDSFITQNKARPTPKELWETAGYAEAGNEKRQTILNDFICANLENEEFILLCNDTEKAWRRIGLGM